MIATDISKSQDRLEAALAKARQLGASGARVSCVQGEAIHASFEAGRLKDTGSEESFGVTVDVLVAGRRAQASARRIQDLDGAVERAIQLAPIGRLLEVELAHLLVADQAPIKIGAVARERISAGRFHLDDFGPPAMQLRNGRRPWHIEGHGNNLDSGKRLHDAFQMDR